jgi:predicted ABC-type sugar transport system permease subunit
MAFKKHCARMISEAAAWERALAPMLPASIFGRRGSIPGSALGAMIVGVFNTGLSLAEVDDYWQMLVVGNLVLIAVGLDRWLRRATK